MSVVALPSEKYQDVFNGFIKHQVAFEVHRSGSIKEIIYKDKTYRFIPFSRTPDEMRLVRCCKEAKSDAKKRKKPVLKNEDKIIQSRILRNDMFWDGEVFFCFDIKACYWQLAFNYDIISIDTYSKYMQEKEKCNIAIGSYAKTTYIERYDLGVMVKRTPMPSKYESQNTFIRQKAFDIYKEINALHKVAYYMTDEYVIPYAANVIRDCMAILAKYKLNAHKTGLYACSNIDRWAITLTNTTKPETEKRIIL